MAERITPMPGAEEGRWPTPVEFTAWYVGLPPEHQARFLDHYIESVTTTRDCFQRNHDGLLRETQYLRATLYRYQCAYWSARRRATRLRGRLHPHVVQAEDVTDWSALPDGTIVRAVGEGVE